MNSIKKILKWIPWLIFLPIFYVITYFKKSVGQNSNRILIFPHNNIGDFVMQTPLYREIKKNFPNYHISLFLTNDELNNLIKYDPYIDSIIRWEINSSFLNKLKIFFHLLFKNYTYAIVIRPESWIDLLALYLVIPYRLSTITKNKGKMAKIIRNVVCSHLISHRNGDYATSIYLKLLNFFKEKHYSNETELHIPQFAVDHIQKLFKEYNTDSNKYNIAIAPSTNNKIKNWKSNKFSKLAQKINKNLEANIFIVGGKKDSKLGTKLVNHIHSENIYNLCGKISLLQFGALCKKLDLLIGLDSGPICIGRALKTRRIVIYGPSDHRETALKTPNSKIIKKDIKCNPCSSIVNISKECPLDNKKCLNQISVDDVYEKVICLLNASP